MMDPILNDKHLHLRDEIRSFAERDIKPLAAELDEKSVFSTELTEKMFDMGLLRMNLSEDDGGMGLDTLSYIIAVEELARVDGSQAATVAAHNSLGIAPIATYGTEEQKRRFLPKLTSGKKLWAFGLTEPNAGSDSNNTETTAILNSGNWIINGGKIYITNIASSHVGRNYRAGGNR